MKPYPKIESLFNRDKKSFKFIEGAYRLPEFEYLKDCLWDGTEKIHGMNIRCLWDCKSVRFGGRTDNAQLPTFLYDKLTEMFPAAKFIEKYSDTPLCLYGEGFGARVQKSGGNYISDGVSFTLFDVLIDKWWLRRDDILDVANKLGISTVPSVGEPMTLLKAIQIVKDDLTSAYGDFEAEGLVLRPCVNLQTRSGSRIIAKVKGNDFA